MAKYICKINGNEVGIDLSLYSTYYEEDSVSDAWYYGNILPFGGFPTTYYYGTQNKQIRASIKSIIKKINFRRSGRYWYIYKIVFNQSLPENTTINIIYYKSNSYENFPSDPVQNQTYMNVSGDSFVLSNPFQMFGGNRDYYKIVINLYKDLYGDLDMTINGLNDHGESGSLWVYSIKRNQYEPLEYIDEYYSSSTGDVYFYPYGNSGDQNNPFWKNS